MRPAVVIALATLLLAGCGTADEAAQALSLWEYAGTSEFRNRTLQNRQSEFLAVLSMVVFSIWLRRRGSPESKPVGEPHASTGAEG